MGMRDRVEMVFVHLQCYSFGFCKLDILDVYGELDDKAIFYFKCRRKYVSEFPLPGITGGKVLFPSDRLARLDEPLTPSSRALLMKSWEKN